MVNRQPLGLEVRAAALAGPRGGFGGAVLVTATGQRGRRNEERGTAMAAFEMAAVVAWEGRVRRIRDIQTELFEIGGIRNCTVETATRSAKTV